MAALCRLLGGGYVEASTQKLYTAQSDMYRSELYS